MKRIACALLLFGGCSFDVNAIVPTSVDDLAVPPDDMSVAPDMRVVDMHVPDDLTVTDMSFPDMSMPDMTPGQYAPAHLGFCFYNLSTATWTITQNTTIDTTFNPPTVSAGPVPSAGLNANINCGDAPTSSVVLKVVGSHAVLALKTLQVGEITDGGYPIPAQLRVQGTRPLIIVAGDSVYVYGTINAGANSSQSGPGGAAPGLGPDGGSAGGGQAGTGTNGAGGGGYGSDGGSGGGGAAGGLMYGDEKLGRLLGGSGGGSTANPGVGFNGCDVVAQGGAGGGALQISARKEFVIAPFPSLPVNEPYVGMVCFGGGGGRGGCGGTTPAGGAGGGSGGSFLLEAPTVRFLDLPDAGYVQGVFEGTGGGGGEGGWNAGNGQSGTNGCDIHPGGHDYNSSRGGDSGGPAIGGNGGNGANVVNPLINGEAKPGQATGAGVGSGGGGGGHGRMYLRVNRIITINGTGEFNYPATFPPANYPPSPVPVIDHTLPDMF